MVGLWRAVRDADLRAGLKARADAEATARACRSLLSDDYILGQLPDETQFVVHADHLAVPPDIAWIAPTPATEPDVVVLARLDAAIRIEATDPDTAAASLHELLQSGLPQGAERMEVLTAAGWQAQRAGAADRVHDLLEALDEDARKDGGFASRLGDPAYARALGSWALLQAAATHTLPAALQRHLALLPAEGTDALLARLRDRGIATEEIAAAHAASVAGRARLRAAQEHLAELLAASSPITRSTGDAVLLFYPGPESGRGALLATDILGAALRSAAARGVPGAIWKGQQVTTAPLPDDAFTIVPGALAVRPLAPPADLWSQPWIIGAAGVALTLAFGLSLFSLFRAVRSEARAMRERADFLTTVTHELKTPLAAIRLLSEMLDEDRVSDDKRPAYYALLSGEAARLTMLIENVLDLGRMERGERAYDRRPCDYSELVDEVVQIFAPLAARDGLQLHRDGDTAPAPGSADRGALTQALLNVLDNARKYATAGGQLHIATARTATTFEVAIRDRGPGIPPAEREQIFDRFTRGRRDRHGSVPGVGLGLYLARVIARRHGGELTCESPPDGGQGTLFRFRFPMHTPHRPEASP